VLSGVLVERGDVAGGLAKWQRLLARQPGVRASDVGRLALPLAPDPQRGRQIERALQQLDEELPRSAS